MVELATALMVIQTISLTVGVIYYIINLQNSNRTQQLTLKAQEDQRETRKLQLLREYHRNVSDQGILYYPEIMRSEWKDYEDFVIKFGYDNNPDFYRKRMWVWREMSFNGLLLRDGIFDIKTMIEYFGDVSFHMWNKYKPIIEETRRRQQNPENHVGLEYFANEIGKYRKSHGITPVTDLIRPKTTSNLQ